MTTVGSTTAPDLLDRWQRMLSPRSVAVVGASDDNYYARALTGNLSRFGFQGTVTGVNPRRSEALGLRCVPTLREVGPVDLTFVAVRRDQVMAVVEDAVALETSGIVVIAEGFRDAHDPAGIDDEAAMARLVRANGVPLVGPNTLGFISPRSSSVFFSVPVTYPVDVGDIALLVQSGGLLSGAAGYLSAMRAGIAYAVSIGNATCVTPAEWIRMMAADDEVRIVGVLLETVGDWTEFRAAIEFATAHGTTVVACMTGRTAEGRAVAQSHTGVLASEYRILADLLGRVGVVLVNGINEWAVTLAMISRFGRPRAAGVGIFGQSGGGNGQLADLCSQAGIALPPPDASTLDAVQQGRFAVAGNPIDVASIAMLDQDAFETAAAAYFGDPQYGAAIYNVTLDPDPFRRGFLTRVQSAAATAECPVVASPTTFTPADAVLLRDFSADRWVLTVPVVEHAIAALAAWLRTAYEPSAVANEVPTLAPDDGLQWRNEFEIKELLRDRGASVPANLWLGPDATSADTVIGLGSSRLAVKGISRRVAHKARWGLVQLVPNDAQRALQAVTALREQAASVGVHLDGVLVEEVVDVGRDVIISVTRDPLGDVVMIGHGGSDAETGPPPGFATIPMSQLDDGDLFSRARIPVEHWAAASALIRLASDLYTEHELDQIEINPVRFDAAGRAWVIDALAFGGQGEAR